MLTCRLLGPYYTIKSVLNSGLGNQMFLYALTRTVAEIKGYNFFIDSNVWQGHGLFNVDLGISDGNIETVFNDNYELTFNPDVFKVEDFTSFNGYFQSEKYFNHDKAREWFKPTITVDCQYSYDDYCYVHFRGGDYSLPPWDNLQLPISYYDDAKKKMLEINPSLKFVIVTNHRQEAVNLFPNDEVVSGSVEEDFVLLSQAKYLIISNSSFSWWVAWLNPSDSIIGPHGWLNYNRGKIIFSPTDIKVERFIWI